MKSRVLRAFDYSFDGVRAKNALVGDEIDFGDMTDGLAAEKYIEPASEAEPVVEVETPEPVIEPVVEPAPDPAGVEPPVVVVVTPEPKQPRKRR